MCVRRQGHARAAQPRVVTATQPAKQASKQASKPEHASPAATSGQRHRDPTAPPPHLVPLKHFDRDTCAGETAIRYGEVDGIVHLVEQRRSRRCWLHVALVRGEDERPRVAVPGTHTHTHAHTRTRTHPYTREETYGIVGIVPRWTGS